MDGSRTDLPVDLMRRIDSLCDQFEDSWRAGSRLRVEDFLVRVHPEERDVLLKELQRLQQELTGGRATHAEADCELSTQMMPAIRESLTTEDLERLRGKSQAPARRDQHRNSAYVTFQVVAGPHLGREFAFNEHDTLVAGRSSQAQLRLGNDPHFSRYHFRLEVNPPTCFLVDLNSSNGTFVNSKRIEEQFLQHGDIVSGGKTKMVVGIFQPDEQEQSASHTKHLPAVKPSSAEQTRPALPQKNIVRSRTDSGDLESQLLAFGYQILGRIGEGDLGVVYQARRFSSPEVCALKVLSPVSHDDDDSIVRFLREAAVLKQLDHPHIIRFIEMGSAGRHIFFATEHVKSIAWNRLVVRYAPEKRIRVACNLMIQLLSALEYAHSRSLVHRDVKPGNILISRTDGKLVAKLADFGIAKHYTTAGMSHVTRDGDVFGSLPFISPDQFLNSREARPTCDIYSAGATFYWMLTGYAPIPLKGRPSKFLAILEEPPTPIQERNHYVSDALASVVHRALAKTPESRFVSASEMKHHLKSAMQWH